MDADNSKIAHGGLFVVPKVVRPVREPMKTFLQHGQVVIKSEFTDQLEVLTNAYMAEYEPANADEKRLVIDLATTRCRCEWVARMQGQPGIAGNEKLVSTLGRYGATNQRQFNRSQKMLLRVQKERKREEALRPRLVKPKTVGEY